EALDDGSDPDSLNESDSETLTFTQGSLPLAFAFKDPGDNTDPLLVPEVEDADGNPIAIYWQLEAGKLVGYLGTENTGPKVIELTLTPGTPTGNQVPVSVTALLLDNIPAHSEINTDNITITGIVVYGDDGSGEPDSKVEGTV